MNNAERAEKLAKELAPAPCVKYLDGEINSWERTAKRKIKAALDVRDEELVAAADKVLKTFAGNRVKCGVVVEPEVEPRHKITETIEYHEAMDRVLAWDALAALVEGVKG